MVFLGPNQMVRGSSKRDGTVTGPHTPTQSGDTLVFVLEEGILWPFGYKGGSKLHQKPYKWKKRKKNRIYYKPLQPLPKGVFPEAAFPPES